MADTAILEVDSSLDEARWAAVLRRDPAMDGRFVYAVKTTGIYCRPSCPSGPAKRGNVRFFADNAAAEAAGFRTCKRCRPDAVVVATAKDGIAGRIAALDWPRIDAELDEGGIGLLGPLLSPTECSDLRSFYEEDHRFRSRVVMQRHGFGSGEYKYFAYPLPDLIGDLRAAVYPEAARTANRWRAMLGQDPFFPDSHRAYLKHCHAAGQRRPTPLLLRYGPGDYNCLHQDLYGPEVLPLQMVILLSEPGPREKGGDFTGGEFVLTEQRPRMQSRAEVVPLRQGEAAIFAVNERPRQGTRGAYRVKLRHGVSRIRSGQRFTAGIIFHDAQ
ncbi:proline hydroxylase [Pelagibius litoralis]|uniref:Proline hydroxylase n=1 Tax=Pelagibius litoralis TaxID=374515 RepID=A0A967KAB5_9PROT|nr:2OG-Fe(II) oxygenase [Pelagibius litoralis]NIA71548.1 proline hydroxylase [Pelagibius litoralis]